MVPSQLRSAWQSAMTPEAMRARLVQRLEDNRGLAPGIANYAVDAWADALGGSPGRSSDRVPEGPAAGLATRARRSWAASACWRWEQWLLRFCIIRNRLPRRLR